MLAWGSNASGQTTIPAGLTNVQALAAGQARVVTLPYSPVLSYPVDVRRDLLVIYNTNTAASVGITDHYRTNRPHASRANYLGLGMHTNYTHTTLFDNTQAPAMLFNPVLQWYTNNPTLRPRYILFSWGVPIWWTNTAPSGWSGAGGSSQNILRETVPGRKPFLGALNMETTNDVAAYIGKLTSFGASSPPLRVLLSASKTGYGNRVFAFNNYYGIDFPTISYMPEAVTALANYGLAGTNSYYVFGRSYGIPAGCGHNSGQTPLTGVTNPAALTTWGVYACQGKDWSSNGAITFSGDAAWYLLQSYESWNANWGTASYITDQAKYTAWFKATAFGGSNYSRTPVGAMSHVAEPKLAGANNSATWNVLWHLGKPLGISTWMAKDAATEPNNYSFHDQTTGDPLVSK